MTGNARMPDAPEGHLSATSSLAEDLKQQLARHPSLSGMQLEFVGRIPARHSELLEFRGRSPGGGAVLVKRITRTRNPAEAGSRLAREFATLEMLATRLDPDVAETLPRAFMLLPEAKAIVLKKLRGRSLALILKRDANRLGGRLRLGRNRDVAFQVGRWLRRFHEVTRRGSQGHDHESYIAALEEQVEQCRQQHGPDRAMTELLERISGASRALDGEPVPSAARHGDFIPQNILVDRLRIAVVDFENFRERDAIYEDVGTFLAYLRMMEGRPFYSRRALRSMSQSFLQGYGSLASPPVLNLYTLKAAVTIAVEFQPRTGMRAILGGKHRVRRQLIDTAHELLTSAGVQPE